MPRLMRPHAPLVDLARVCAARAPMRRQPCHRSKEPKKTLLMMSLERPGGVVDGDTVPPETARGDAAWLNSFGMPAERVGVPDGSDSLSRTKGVHHERALASANHCGLRCPVLPGRIVQA